MKGEDSRARERGGTKRTMRVRRRRLLKVGGKFASAAKLTQLSSLSHSAPKAKLWFSRLGARARSSTPSQPSIVAAATASSPLPYTSSLALQTIYIYMCICISSLSYISNSIFFSRHHFISHAILISMR